MSEPATAFQQETSRGRWPWLPIALLGIALLVAACAVLWLRQSPIPSQAPTSVAGPALPVTGVFIEPGDGRAPLLDEIQSARRSIDLEVYIVTDDVVLQALEEAQRRGVEVRVILEEHPFGGGGGQDEIFARLESAGIEVRWGNPVFRFTHIKLLVVDEAVAIIMNQNLT
jgi:cardiolipin synthase A/B